MAAEVGCMIRAVNNRQSDQTKLVTRDLLGGSFSSPSNEIDHSQELDLDLQVPFGWEKRLDLKSGKVYLQKCSFASEPSPSATRKPLQYTKYNSTLNIMEETSLGLKLEWNSTSINNNNSCSYESVCTMDKVRSALDRAKNEQIRMMFFPRSSKSPSTSSTSTRISLELDTEEDDQRTIDSKSQQQNGLLTAAGCPNCLMYVMISNENPKCPKCSLTVSMPMMKKRRIDLDLNISI